MISIRKMTVEHIGFAHSLTEIEEWHYLRDDIKRLIEFEPEGCFVAFMNDTPVGIVTSTTYDHFAFIGTLIVVEQYRNQKIGELLILHVLDYLKSKSITTVELDGVIPALPLYRRLGFKDKYFSLRFSRSADQNRVLEKPAENIVEQGLLDFDESLTGLKRGRMLKNYFENMPESVYTEYTNNNLIAYALVRPRSGGNVAIGPLLAKDIMAAENLLNRIIAIKGNYNLQIGTPMIDIEAANMLAKYNFIQGQPSLRMYYGTYLTYESNIYGIFSAEKG